MESLAVRRWGSREKLEKLIADQARDRARDERWARRARPATGPDGEPAGGLDLDAIPARTAEPWAIVAAAEADEAALADRRGPRHWRTLHVPRPGIILALTGWSPALERPPRAGEACAVCGGARLAINALCLACLRSGAEGRLETVRDHERPRAADPVALGLEGGVGRRARFTLARS